VKTDKERDETIAKLADIVRVLAQNASASYPYDLELWHSREAEAAKIAQQFSQRTTEASRDPNYEPGGQWSGGPGMPYGS
jgi:hypothetical protein